MARTPAPGTREKILDVAARLFYAHGVRAVGMKQIIDVAGTGKNLLYRHFPGKDDLVAAYLSQVHRLRERAATAALRTAGDDPGDGLVALVAEVGEQVRHPGFRGCAFRNYLVEFPTEVCPDGPGPAGVVLRGAPTPAGGVPAPRAVALGMLRDTRARIDELAVRLVGAGNGAAELAERVWLIVDGLYLQGAYRAGLDDGLSASVAAAVGLVRRIVEDARTGAT